MNISERLELILDSDKREKISFKVRRMINLGRTSRNPNNIVEHLINYFEF